MSSPVMTGWGAPVALTTASAQLSAVSNSCQPSACAPTRAASALALPKVRLITARCVAPRCCSACAASLAMTPDPTTSTRVSARSDPNSAWSNCAATWPTEVVWRLMTVSVRARFPAWIACMKSCVSTGPATPAAAAVSSAAVTWPRI